MALKIYNTLSREKELFVSIEPHKVKMYVCGPTVYDYIHIGNARPMIFFDVVRRYLTKLGYEVAYVVNITDVDDKMIRKAEQSGVDVPDLAEKYIAAFAEDCSALGILQAANPRVMDHIEEIIGFIESLVTKGCAYENGGDVFFRTSKSKDYGKLSRQNLDELQFGIRVEVDERKENPQDFVLWKMAKPGEIYWSSPWGNGRPGWHIECSTLVLRFLGETIDIHGGGQDLQFPHHECEIAQSEALTGKPMVHYWMHNGYIHIHNEKMSKSLGNGFHVRDLLQNVSPEVVRFFMLSAHYRNPLNFSDELVRQAENSLERLNTCVANLQHRLKTLERSSAKSLESVQVTDDVERLLNLDVSAIDQQFTQKMDDDFNTADALTAMFDLANVANRYLQQENVDAASLKLVLQKFVEMNEVLGILNTAPDEFLAEEIEHLIQQRNLARETKNWSQADDIRDKLLSMDIVIEDTPQGVRWRRK